MGFVGAIRILVLPSNPDIGIAQQLIAKQVHISHSPADHVHFSEA
jgi:hypothetical protein